MNTRILFAGRRVRSLIAGLMLLLLQLAVATPAGAAGAHGDDRIWDSTIATDGSVALVGDFIGTASFGGKTMRSLGAYDGFISVFNADGSHRWSRRVGTPGTDHLWRAEFDGLGSVYVAGVMRGQLTIGAVRYGDPLRCSSTDNCQDISTIVKFSRDGDVLWRWQRTGDWNEIRDFVVDRQNHLWVADAWLYRIGEPAFGSRFIRFSPDGAIVAGNGTQSRYSDGLLVYDLTIDSRGDIVASGHFNCLPKLDDAGLRVNTATKGAVLTPSADAQALALCYVSANSPRNAFVIKFSPEGVLRWSRAIGGEFNPEDACCEWLGQVRSLPDGTLLAGIGELKRTFAFHNGKRSARSTAIVVSPAGDILGEFRNGANSGLAVTDRWLVTLTTRYGSRADQLTLTEIIGSGSMGGTRREIDAPGIIQFKTTPNGRFVAVFAMWRPSELPISEIGIEGISTLKRSSGVRHLVLVGSLVDTIALTWKKGF